MAEPDAGELQQWSQREIIQDAGGENAAKAFADVADWGNERDEVEGLVRDLTQQLGISEEIKIDWQDAQDERAGASVSGGWEPYSRRLIIVVPHWKTSRGWKRLDTIAHEMMHAAQTAGKDWEERWAEMTKLAKVLRVEHANDHERWLAICRYRNHPFEAEAINFGRRYRDRFRKSQ